jgi:hypothetical protein
MKPAHFLPIALLSLAAAAEARPAGPQLPRAPEPRAHPLAYVVTRSGLEPPGLDGGRTELEMFDVDGDGHVDLGSVGDHGSPLIGSSQHGIMIWFGDGRGSFAVQMRGDFGYGGIAFGDVNGDGLVDAGYGVHHDYSSSDFGDQLIEVALGDGTGTGWTPWDDGLASGGETYGMMGTDFADVDADGDLDLACNSFGCCNGVHVYRNHLDGSWTWSFGASGGNSDEDVTFADVDGDGHFDLVVGAQVGSVWRGDGAGGFAAADGNLPADSWYGTDAGDVDGDGRDEISFTGLAGGVRVCAWTPGDVWLSVSAGLPASGPYQRTQLCDMDLDGNVDVVALGEGELAVFLGDGHGNWHQTVARDVPGGGSRWGEAFEVGGDFDHNGFPDLALVQDEDTFPGGGTNELYVLLEGSTPTELTLAPVAPGRGRVWRGGQVRFVEWASAAPSAAPGSVSVDFSSTGPAGPWTTLAARVPNNGRVQVVAPSGVSSSDCRLRYRVTTASASRTAIGRRFTIVP